ncbi:MAG: tetratricopeptide repeat protein [Candidatus Hodarchaeales archaeon]|jgi:tetratricopeptide (TPR) repeat protein
MPRRYTPIQIHKAIKSADAVFDKKQYSKAVEKYKRVLNMDRGSAYGWFKLGLTYQRINKLNEALEAYSESLNVELNFEVLYNKALILLQKEQYKEAEDTFKKTLTIAENTEQKNYIAWINLGRVYLANKNPKSARKAINKAREIKPEEPLVYYLLGDTYRLLKKISESIWSYEKSLELNPLFREAIINFCSLLLEIKDASRAISLISRYLKQKPEDIELWGIKGEIHVSMNDFENGRVSFAKARNQQPDNVEYLIKEGRCLQALEKSLEALELIDKFLDSNINVDVLIYKAEIHAMLSQKEKAGETLESILRDFSEVIQEPNLCVSVANIYSINKNLEKAEELFKHALTLGFMNSWQIHKQLTIIAFEKGQIEEAKKRCLEIIELAKNSNQKTQGLHLKTLIDLKQKNYIEAEKTVTMGLNVAEKSGNTELLILLTLLQAKTLQKLEKQKNAKKTLEKLIKKYDQVKMLIKSDTDLKDLFSEEELQSD